MVKEKRNNLIVTNEEIEQLKNINEYIGACLQKLKKQFRLQEIEKLINFTKDNNFLEL